MGNLIENIVTFVNNEELKTMTIKFSELEAEYSGSNSVLLKKTTRNATLHLDKKFFVEDYSSNILFSIPSGGYVEIYLYVKTINMPQNIGAHTVKIKHFNKSGINWLRGDKIIITSNPLFISAGDSESRGVKGNNTCHLYKDVIDISHSKNDIGITGESTSSEGKNCFIATLAYGNIEHPNVEILRNYRDKYLLNSTLGKSFIKVYYLLSPKIVKLITPFHFIHKIIRMLLDFIIKKFLIKKVNDTLN